MGKTYADGRKQHAKPVRSRKVAEYEEVRRGLAEARPKDYRVMHKRHLEAVEYFMQGASKKEALIKAGYSPTTADKAAFRIFGREDVQRELEKRQQRMEQRSEKIIDRIQDELAKIAFFNIGTITRVTEDGELVVDFDEANMDDLAAIGECTVETYVEGRGASAETVKRVKVKPYDKKAALDSLARIHGMFNDKLTLGTEDDLEKRLLRGRERAGKRLSAPEVIEGDWEEV
jgi:phage terminase small subunit